MLRRCVVVEGNKSSATTGRAVGVSSADWLNKAPHHRLVRVSSSILEGDKIFVLIFPPHHNLHLVSSGIAAQLHRLCHRTRSDHDSAQRPGHGFMLKSTTGPHTRW